MSTPSYLSSWLRANRKRRTQTSESELADDLKPVEVEYKCYKHKFPWIEVEAYLKTVFPDWTGFDHTYEKDRYKFYVPPGETLLPVHKQELDRRRSRYQAANQSPAAPSTNTSDNYNTSSALPAQIQSNRTGSQSPSR